MKKNGRFKGRVLRSVLSTVLAAAAFNSAVIGAAAYNDGTYTGTAKGRNGDISVSVTVADGNISSIDVTDQKETPSFWTMAQSIIPNIISANKTEDVDAVTGATISSQAIKDAVADALKKSVPTGIFDSGEGTGVSPYIIKTAAQLAAFAESVDGGESYRGKYIALDADIDLTDFGNWDPIGAEGAASTNLDKLFAGNFDGRGHIIKGLTVKTAVPYTAETNVGLFSTLLSGAKVSGIRLEDVDINVSGSSKVVRAGAVTGDIASNTVSKTDGSAVVDSCTANGSITAKTDTAMVMTGGIVGRASANAVISNCQSNVTVGSSSGTKTAYGAGIVSMAGNSTYVVNCVNSGDITVTTDSGFSLYAGGVVGMMTSEQYNCFSSGNVTVGTIDAKDAANNAGILNGALMPAAKGSFDHYSSDAKLSHVDTEGNITALNAVSHGADSMNAEGSFTPTAVTVNSELADTLNNDLNEVSKILKAENLYMELKLWKYSDNKLLLSDEVFVNKTIDKSVFESGEGTKESPFKIANAEQLRAFAGSLTEHIDYTGTFIELSKDIDVSDKEWTPVGDSSYAFNGSFDGKGHTVSGMTVGSEETAKELTSDEIYVGFFSVLDTNAVVKDLNLTDVLVNVSYKATAYAGGIAAAMTSEDSGYKGAVIDGCSVKGKMTVTAETGNNFVGGISAYVYKGAIINCKSDVDASCTVKTGGSYGETGGIAALINRALVANCYSLGNVYASGDRDDEGMAVASSLVAVNAGYLANCYGSGKHETNDYSVYTGAVSGWITGIGHAYDCYYNGDAVMKIGSSRVDPVADVGTRVSSGVSDDGMVYTGGVVFGNESYNAENYINIASKLNDNFKAFPVEITQFGLTNDSLKSWKYDSEVTFADEYASASYVQPEAEIVVKPELALNDGTWYGRGKDKKVVVTITVKDGKITKTVSSDGSSSGEAYEEALKAAKDKSTYGDKTGYGAADVSKFAGGKGTETEPYLIKTEAQLRYIAEAMNDDVDWENIWFALDSDITLTGGDWLPIGYAIQAEINGQKENFSVYPFRGNFDGKGHTISGLTIGSNDKPADIYLAGLFGLAVGAHDTNLTPSADERLVNIRNVKLKNISFNVNSRYEANVGGLVAWAQNGFVIDNCFAEGEINVSAKESFARVGGLVGSTLRGVVTDCGTNVKINASAGTSSVYAGGLAGMTNRSAQVNCYALGSVTAGAENNNKATVGGLTGMSGGTNINCYAYGDVESLITTVDVGGLNGRSAGIALDYECFYNSSAVHKNAGKEITEKKASGTLVGEEVKCYPKTSEEMASESFTEALNSNKENMTDILKDVSAHLDDISENNREGLSHLLFYTNDGTDLNSWTKGENSPVFGKSENVAVTTAVTTSVSVTTGTTVTTVSSSTSKSKTTSSVTTASGKVTTKSSVTSSSAKATATTLTSKTTSKKTSSTSKTTASISITKPVTSKATKSTTTQKNTKPFTTTATHSAIDLSGIIYGDVDLDGNVDLADVTTLAKHLLSGVSYPLGNRSEGSKERAEISADVNGDRIIDARDLSKLIEYNLGQLSLRDLTPIVK